MPVTRETRLLACKRVGIAADHGGFELKKQLTKRLRGEGYEVVDFGNCQRTPVVRALNVGSSSIRLSAYRTGLHRPARSQPIHCWR